jgi:ubiquinone/menaquinone biosynthesis C-methylase UbiE
MREPILEPILRNMRIKRVLPIIRKIKNPILLDIGCGWEAKFLQSIEDYVEEAVGIDFKAPNLNTKKIKTFKQVITNTLPFDDSKFNIVTMLAVLEHIADPLSLVKEIKRILVGGGYVVITVPSKVSKPILEFLSYKLNIVNPEEIRDHKKYYNKKDIEELFIPYGFKIVRHKYFQLGMNNFCILRKGS